MTYAILYRGSLSSCNYACPYCPFAKQRNTRAELARDKEGLQRFFNWIRSHSNYQFQILFTPWGEAMVRRYYRDTLVDLSQLPQVTRVAVQTNLSFPIKSLAGADPAKTAMWATYHPGQTNHLEFLKQCARLDKLGIDYSVGVVGLKEHLEAIAALREALPPERYLWVNAYKREADYYSPEMIEFLCGIDPHFPTNNQYHKSAGRRCHTGQTGFTVDNRGDMRRCHFVGDVIGNINAFPKGLKERPCPNDTCGCHIGYIHLEHLGLHKVYQHGLMPRIPAAWPQEV